jgi:hypothetical protein
MKRRRYRLSARYTWRTCIIHNGAIHIKKYVVLRCVFISQVSNICNTCQHHIIFTLVYPMLLSNYHRILNFWKWTRAHTLFFWAQNHIIHVAMKSNRHPKSPRIYGKNDYGAFP